MEKQCKARKNPQIHLGKPFNKAFQNLKSYIFVGYKKLPKIPFLNPLKQNSRHKLHNRHELDELFKGFSENWKSNLEQSRNKNNNPSYPENNNDPQIRRRKTEEEEEKKKKLQLQEAKGNETGNKLAVKMKEFDMLEAEDVHHLQDIEEVLDSYSRLTSPIYVEMVDEFFMDMYAEFSVPKPSVPVSRNSSMRRHGSCNCSMRRVESCNSSMRRLAPLKL